MKNTHIVVLLLLTTITFSGFGHADHTDPHPDNYVPFALTISGGISLGSYEAGLNWALIRYLKLKRAKYKDSGKIYPQLKAITGASAGSINAIASAISWCVDENRVQQLSNNGEAVFHDIIDDNLFRDVWLQVGMSNLLPKSYQTDYAEDDALLSRKAFEQVIDKITRLLSQPIYRDDCSIPIGITLTQVEPTEISIAGVHVQNQRVTIPVTLSSHPHGSGEVQLQPLLIKDAVLSNVVHLPLRPTPNGGSNEIAARDMLEAVQASSAFPIAFSGRTLDYCRDSTTAKDAIRDMQPTLDFKCARGYTPHRAGFIDGGVFDNIPLGLAKRLAEPDPYAIKTAQQWSDSQRPYSYIYFDPGNRRATSVTAEHPESPEAPQSQGGTPVGSHNGLLSQLKFLEGALVTGQNYELYAALRDGSWTQQIYFFLDKLERVLDDESTQPIRAKIELLGKKYRGPIGEDTGCDHESCAGQITALRDSVINDMRLLADKADEQLTLEILSARDDKLGDRLLILPTRFAPITGAMLMHFGAFFDAPFREYDYQAGVYDAVIKLARYICGGRDPDSKLGSCMEEQIPAVYTELGIRSDNEANTVFRLSLEKEFGLQFADAFFADDDSRAPFELHPVMETLFNSLIASDRIIDGVHQDPDFTAFLSELQKNGYRQYIDENNELMLRIIDTRDPTQGHRWAQLAVERVSDRLVHLEREAKDDVRALIGSAALVAQSYIHDEGQGFYKNRGTAPDDSFAALLPHSIDIDFRNGGGTLSWEPGLRLGRRWNAELKISPVHHNRFANNEIFFSQTDLFLVRKLDYGFLSSVAIGPTHTYTWKQWPNSRQSNLGSSLYMGLFKDKLRLTLGQRTGNSNYSDFPGDTAYFYIGVTDLPGIYYWIFK